MLSRYFCNILYTGTVKTSLSRRNCRESGPFDFYSRIGKISRSYSREICHLEQTTFFERIVNNRRRSVDFVVPRNEYTKLQWNSRVPRFCLDALCSQRLVTEEITVNCRESGPFDFDFRISSSRARKNHGRALEKFPTQSRLRSPRESPTIVFDFRTLSSLLMSIQNCNETLEFQGVWMHSAPEDSSQKRPGSPDPILEHPEHSCSDFCTRWSAVIVGTTRWFGKFSRGWYFSLHSPNR